MKYNLDLNNSKGNNKLGDTINENDPGEHGHVLTKEESTVLAATLGGYVQDLDANFWLIRVDCENPVGTVLLTAGGDHRIYMLNSDDFPDGAIFPMTTLLEWKKHNLNVAVLGSNVCAEWGWNFSVYQTKFDALTTDILLEKMFNGALPPSKPDVFAYLHGIETAIAVLRLDNLPLSVIGHCTSTALITKYIVLANDYKFKSVILISPIFVKEFSNVISPYERYIKKSEIPTLVINHRDDPCYYVSSEISKQISKDRIILSGGTNAGCPNFSLGHHGYREIETALVNAIADFIV
jgi:hypothetical protein